LVADGNFKADHVKQKNNNDVWLMDGGGMVPNQKEYSNFLKKALEIPTVSVNPDAGSGSAAGPVEISYGSRSRARSRNRFISFLMLFYFLLEGSL
jgi:hypothetical protein